MLNTLWLGGSSFVQSELAGLRRAVPEEPQRSDRGLRVSENAASHLWTLRELLLLLLRTTYSHVGPKPYMLKAQHFENIPLCAAPAMNSEP